MGYGEVDISEAANAGYFALPALFITFRETLEAAIIISVLLGLVEKMNVTHLKRYVWLGVLAGSAVSILAAIIFIIILTVIKDNFLEPGSEKIVEGAMSIIASILIAVVAFTIGNVMAIQAKWEAKLQHELEDGKSKAITKNTILFLSFTAVVREGLETIIFFAGIGASFPPESLPIPAVVGAVLGAIAGVALYKFGGRLSIQIFFIATMVLLVFIGAGMFTIGVHGLQEAGTFGIWDPEDQRPQLNVVLYDISECCGLDKSEFWVLMRVLFGYSPNPTGLEMLAYFGYHIVVWIALAIRYRLQKRKPYMHKNDVVDEKDKVESEHSVPSSDVDKKPSFDSLQKV